MAYEITEKWMKEQIDYSNNQAAKNRNFYPIQEQATQMELWEYVPCTCEETCTCKKFGCTHHWKLKKDVHFDNFVVGFLRTFVDRSEHLNIIMAIDRQDPTYLNLRVKDAYWTLQKLEQEWTLLSVKAVEHNKTLFCDGWADDFFRNCWEKFKVQNSVYLAKQYCLLIPDICVPYDTESRKKMLKHLKIESNANYFEFLSKVREKFLESMIAHQLTLRLIRSLDSPEKHLPFNRRLISLPRCEMDYGTGYLPKEHQISFILDKCYYQPKGSSKSSSMKEKTSR